MKALRCEMCGDTNLLKTDGMFVCQSCGCKYTVDEAKKMFIDGTVNVQGTVKIDKDDYIQKCLENARSAKEKEDWEETEKYYAIVKQNQPNNIEAIFYGVYGRAKASLMVNDIYKRQEIFNVLSNCIFSIGENFGTKDSNDNVTIIDNIARDLVALICGNFVYTKYQQGGFIPITVSTDQDKTYKLYLQIISDFSGALLKIQKKYPIPEYFQISIAFLEACKSVYFVGYNQLDVMRRIDAIIERQKEELEDVLAERNKKYWSEHKEEFNSLENEKSHLYVSIEELKKERKNIPEVKNYIRIQDKIAENEYEIASLGFFKGKQKIALQREIERLKREESEAKEKADKASKDIDGKIRNMNKRIEQIENEYRTQR